MRNRPHLLCRVLAALAATLGTLQAQLPEQSTSVYRVEEGTLIEWTAHEGRTYFVQISDEADPLLRWVWAPVIESGNGQVISHEIGGDGARGFARLKYSTRSHLPGLPWNSGMLMAMACQTGGK